MPLEFAKLFATFFNVGYCPVAPGTSASVVAVGICFALHHNPSAYLATLILVSVVGFLTTGQVERHLGKKDPSCVVIDEVAGVMMAFFLLPLTPAIVVTAFFLFRAFDMFKVYPMNQWEEWEGAPGIMLDDLLAGVYTNMTMHLAIQLAEFI